MDLNKLYSDPKLPKSDQSRINQAEREDGREINSMHITEESPNGRMLEGWIVVAAVEGHMRCVWKPRREHLDWLL
jgi:hypothetical protein